MLAVNYVRTFIYEPRSYNSRSVLWITILLKEKSMNYTQVCSAVGEVIPKDLKINNFIYCILLLISLPMSLVFAYFRKNKPFSGWIEIFHSRVSALGLHTVFNI